MSKTRQGKARWPGRAAWCATVLLVALFCVRGNVEMALLPLLREARKSTERSRARSCEGDTPVIVVLSGGVWSAELPSESTLQRLLTAVKLALPRGEPRRAFVFSGGFNPAAGEAEAVVMARYFQILAANRAPEARIFTETRARDTHENALFTRELMDTYHLGRSAVLVTSGYHLPRAVASFKAQGVDVCPWAAPSPDLVSLGYFNFFNARNFSRVLHEYLGIAWYAARGWLRDPS